LNGLFNKILKVFHVKKDKWIAPQTYSNNKNYKSCPNFYKMNFFVIFKMFRQLNKMNKQILFIICLLLILSINRCIIFKFTFKHLIWALLFWIWWIKDFNRLLVYFYLLQWNSRTFLEYRTESNRTESNQIQSNRTEPNRIFSIFRCFFEFGSIEPNS